MAKTFESTAADLPAALAQHGVSGDHLVIAKVYSPEDAALLRERRRLVQEGLASGEPIDADIVYERVCARLREELGQNRA